MSSQASGEGAGTGVHCGRTPTSHRHSTHSRPQHTARTVTFWLNSCGDHVPTDCDLVTPVSIVDAVIPALAGRPPWLWGPLRMREFLPQTRPPCLGRGRGLWELSLRRTVSPCLKPSPSPCVRGVSQEKDGQISSAIVSSVQSKITQVGRPRPSPAPRSERPGAGMHPAVGGLPLNPAPPRTLPGS